MQLTVDNRRILLGDRHPNVLRSEMELAHNKQQNAKDLIRMTVGIWRSFCFNDEPLPSSSSDKDKEVVSSNEIQVDLPDIEPLRLTLMRQTSSNNSDPLLEHGSTKFEPEMMKYRLYDALDVKTRIRLSSIISPRNTEERDEIFCDLQELLIGRRELLGARHPHALETYIRYIQTLLALTPENQGIDTSLLPEMETTVNQLHASLGGELHPRTLEAMMMHAMLMRRTKPVTYVGSSDDIALALAQKAYEGFKTVLGESHPDVLLARTMVDNRMQDIQTYASSSGSCFSPDTLLLMADET